MKEINLTKEELKNSLKGNYIDSGSEASIYLHNPKKKDVENQNTFMAKRLYDKNLEDVYSSATGKKIGKQGEESFIKNLLVYKENIKLTTLPLGIIKEDGIVVGQLIKYYNNSQTLTNYFKENKEINPLPYYYKVLDILEELVNNNICYEDVHGGNFLIVNNSLKLIEFSQHRVKINEQYNGMYYNMFQNFVSMVNKLNLKILEQENNFERFLLPSEIKNDTQNLKEDFNYIREHLPLIRKK